MSLRLAIADPPYLGRAHRWYGVGGRGSGGGRHRADEHPAAAVWDDPARHAELVAQLHSEYDGWAIAAAATSAPLYLSLVPEETRMLVWRRRNAPPSGHRVRWTWEPVFVYTPADRRTYGSGLAVDDVLDVPAGRAGFAGSKPAAWTRWVLDALGHQPADTVVDIFTGSGAVEASLRQQVLL